MRSVWMIVRCGGEGLLGMLFLLNTPIQLVRIVAMVRSSQSTSAYLLGGLFGVCLCAVLGFLLVRDAIRVGRRIRSAQAA